MKPLTARLSDLLNSDSMNRMPCLYTDLCLHVTLHAILISLASLFWHKLWEIPYFGAKNFQADLGFVKMGQFIPDRKQKDQHFL